MYNLHLPGFRTGKLYKGLFKSVCIPGLNCYSCPGAVAACPIGALQAVASTAEARIAWFVVGFLSLVGALAGRLVCGWACPFGLIQEWLHKIPAPKFKHLRRYRVWRALLKLKYAVLILFVFLLPNILSGGTPAFCAYICPAGTLQAGIMVLLDTRLQGAVGVLYRWKVAVLLVTLIACVVIYRPFCRLLCPLGAFYAPFNRISLLTLRVDAGRCTHCQTCSSACQMEVAPANNPADTECIRCGHCVKACPQGALRLSVRTESGAPKQKKRVSGRNCV